MAFRIIRDITRFNGATRFQRGRFAAKLREIPEVKDASMGPRVFSVEDRCIHKNVLPVLAASMGPRVFSVEDDTDGHICVVTSKGFNGATRFQRGRFDIVPHFGHRDILASMGPRVFSVEDLIDKDRDVVDWWASMGPRVFSVEDLSEGEQEKAQPGASMGPRVFSVEDVRAIILIIQTH